MLALPNFQLSAAVKSCSSRSSSKFDFFPAWNIVVVLFVLFTLQSVGSLWRMLRGAQKFYAWSDYCMMCVSYLGSDHQQYWHELKTTITLDFLDNETFITEIVIISMLWEMLLILSLYLSSIKSILYTSKVILWDWILCCIVHHTFHHYQKIMWRKHRNIQNCFCIKIILHRKYLNFNSDRIRCRFHIGCLRCNISRHSF